MPEPSYTLLREMASVPIASRILEFSFPEHSQAVHLARLGFDTHHIAPVGETDQTPGLAEDADSRSALFMHEAAASGETFPFEENSFDWIVSIKTLHDLPDGLLVWTLEELFRGLAEGGWMYAVLPADENDDLTTHTRVQDTWDQAFYSAGFVAAKSWAKVENDSAAGYHVVFRKPGAHVVG